MWCVKHIHIHEIYGASVNGVIDLDNVIDTCIDCGNCFFVLLYNNHEVLKLDFLTKDIINNRRFRSY